MGLPPSLLGMAEEVRRERGPERVRKMMENIASCRQQADSILNEVGPLGISSRLVQSIHTYFPGVLIYFVVFLRRRWTRSIKKLRRTKPSARVTTRRLRPPDGPVRPRTMSTSI